MKIVSKQFDVEGNQLVEFKGDKFGFSVMVDSYGDIDLEKNVFMTADTGDARGFCHEICTEDGREDFYNSLETLLEEHDRENVHYPNFIRNNMVEFFETLSNIESPDDESNKLSGQIERFTMTNEKTTELRFWLIGSKSSLLLSKEHHKLILIRNKFLLGKNIEHPEVQKLKSFLESLNIASPIVAIRGLQKRILDHIEDIFGSSEIKSLMRSCIEQVSDSKPEENPQTDPPVCKDVPFKEIIFPYSSKDLMLPIVSDYLYAIRRILRHMENRGEISHIMEPCASQVHTKLLENQEYINMRKELLESQKMFGSLLSTAFITELGAIFMALVYGAELTSMQGLHADGERKYSFFGEESLEEQFYRFFCSMNQDRIKAISAEISSPFVRQWRLMF